jgi:hypothetical protein
MLALILHQSVSSPAWSLKRHVSNAVYRQLLIDAQK